MFITRNELRENPKFHQAVTLCELGGMSWRSIYMDPSNELAIQFNGKLTLKQIKTVLIHFLDLIAGECNTEEINPQERVDYRYGWDNKAYYTEVYTPDGWDFKAFTMPHKEYTEEDEEFFKAFEEMQRAMQEEHNFEIEWD